MIAGHIGQFNGLAARYASASGTPILSADYRLAPAHRHPVPVEDAYAALVWLHEHAVGLGVDPGRIGVFGDSAGGGLAAAVSILARDRKGPAIAKQILVMPMLDDRTLTPDPQLARFAVWSWDDNRTGWGALLSDAGGSDTPAYAAPARVADPAGLPPAYIEVGQLDIFRDEDLTRRRGVTPNAVNLPREGATINAELRCYVQVKAPNSYTRLPRSTDLPCYLEL
jgi:acetyl esterase/lipase